MLYFSHFWDTRSDTIHKKLRITLVMFALKFLGIISGVFLLSGCITNVLTGATLLYDRHSIYNQLTDYELSAKLQRELYIDRTFSPSICPPCSVEIAVLNADVLLVGHVPTKEMRQLAFERAKLVPGYRSLYNQITISQESSNSIVDSWITSNIRSQVFADSSIDPKVFKIVTVDGVVYIMGDILEEQADRLVELVRNTAQVKRVVKLFHALVEHEKYKPQ